MAKFVFLNFATFGQINPTLAIIRELVAGGDEVVYFQSSERFRVSIAAAGATLRIYDAALLQQARSGDAVTADDNRRLALLPIRMIQISARMVPQLSALVQAERPDCLVYSGLFLWARIIAHALDIPGVALWPTYAPNTQFSTFLRDGMAAALSPDTRGRLNDELASLRDTYHLPFLDIGSLIRGQEGLTLVFLPRAFQPGGDTYNERFLFVGPSLDPDRDTGQSFPRERLRAGPHVYIALGTIYNNQAEFYNMCFRAFGNTKWQIILSLGTRIDRAQLQSIPANFITAPYVPQLAVLPEMDIFISHGGMNSTMESLYFGVPLIVIPHTNEQKMTAQRVQDLGLGISLDGTTITADILRAAATQITQEPGLKERVHAMQQHVREAGGYQRATDALQRYIHV